MHASHDGPTPDTRTAARPARRTLLLIVGVLVLLGTAAGCWWRWHVPQYHLAGRYLAQDATLLACTTGFWLRESDTDFVLRAWDGTERWRVQIADPSAATRPKGPLGGPRFRFPFFATLAFAVSPDGRVFAAAIPTGAQTRVQCWRDGGLVTDLLLPAPPFAPMLRRVHVLDSGRVFVWECARNLPPAATVIEQQRIIARGTLPSDALLSPEGTVMVSPETQGFAYHTLAVRNGAILATRRYTARDGLAVTRMPGYIQEYSLFAQGYVLADDGARYGPQGLISPAGPWAHNTITPGKRYTLESSGPQSRVLSPVTGDSWGYTVRGGNQGGDATADGRYALAYCRAQIPPDVQRLLVTFPGLTDWLGRSSLDYLALYERPGRLRAVMRLDMAHLLPGTEVDSYCWYPSPDGRAVVLAADGSKGACLLFRW